MDRTDVTFTLERFVRKATKKEIADYRRINEAAMLGNVEYWKKQLITGNEREKKYARENLAFYGGDDPLAKDIEGLDKWEPAVDTLKKLGIKADCGGTASVPADSPEFEKLLRLVSIDKKLRFERVQDIVQKPDPKLIGKWYLLRPEWELDISTERGMLEVRADRARSKHHIGIAGEEVAFDEEAIAALRAADCHGCEFAWIPDIGRQPARQWFVITPTQPIGRGVVHEIADFEKQRIHAGEGWDSISPDQPTALHIVDGKFLRTDSRTPTKTLQLLAKVAEHVAVETPYRVLRRALPKTDVAFYRMRHDVLVCVNRKVRDLLLKNKLVPAAWLSDIEIVDDVPAGSPDLDKLYGTLPPAESPAERKKRVTRAAEAYARFVDKKAGAKVSGTKEPLSKGNLDKILDRWKAFRRAVPEFFTEGAGATDNQLTAAEAKLKRPIPQPWRRFLSHIGECSLFYQLDFELTPVERLPRFQRESAGWFDRDTPITKAESKSYLFVASRGSGDMYALNLKEIVDSECPVLLIDHEGPDIKSEWPTIAKFLEDIVSEFESISPAKLKKIRKKYSL